jgi:hypothetical protein
VALQQVKQGFIQFQSNGVPIAPRDQLSASDPDSQLSSNPSVSSTLLLLKNSWPINQGEVFTLSSASLNASSSSGGDITTIKMKQQATVKPDMRIL